MTNGYRIGINIQPKHLSEQHRATIYLQILIYSAGFTAKQIAEMLHRSLYTIENHIAKIHKKKNCKDKSSLRKYVIDHGWDGLEKFFFSYLPDKPH